MSPLAHSLRTLLSRLRWEVLGFVVLVAASAIADLTTSATAAPISTLKTLAFLWLTLRIALSETGFKTHGGWQTRPFNPRTVLAAQGLLLLALAATLLLSRILILEMTFHPAGGQWVAVAKDSLTREVLPWLVLLICLKGFAFLLLRPLEGRARKAAWAAMVIALVPCVGIIIHAGTAPYSSQGGSANLNTLSPGIRAQLPDATEFIGLWWEYQSSGEFPNARLIARIPLDGSDPGVSELKVLSVNSTVSDARFVLDIDLTSFDSRLLGLITEAAPVIAYPGGYYGSALTYNIRRTSGRGILAATPTLLYQLSFASPLCLPEHRDAVPAAFHPNEILFFAPGDELIEQPADIPSPLNRDAKPLPPHFIPPPTVGDAFGRSVRQLIDSFANRDSRSSDDTIPLLVDSLYPEAMAPILDYEPWPEAAWKEMILPFLEKHADDSHKDQLIERLGRDPRLTRLFIDNGWSADAVPPLRRRAAERLPLSADAIVLLAGENDPALAADLAAIAIRLRRGIGELSDDLRSSRGFDWPAFVEAGWRSRKYGTYRYDREGWLYALWAAELGDASALRRLAREAAVGKNWEREHLARLIPEAPPEILPFLRSRLDDLRFDPETRTWVLP